MDHKCDGRKRKGTLDCDETCKKSKKDKYTPEIVEEIRQKNIAEYEAKQRSKEEKERKQNQSKVTYLKVANDWLSTELSKIDKNDSKPHDLYLEFKKHCCETFGTAKPKTWNIRWEKEGPRKEDFEKALNEIIQNRKQQPKLKHIENGNNATLSSSPLKRYKLNI